MSNVTAPRFVCGVEICFDDANAKGHGPAGTEKAPPKRRPSSQPVLGSQDMLRPA
jgi:hypothetical protein